MTIGFLMAYFYKGALWKRIFLFLSSIPITLFMNSLRVGIIGITVEHWGIGMAEGFLHEFQGWMVFMLSAALMLGEITLLNNIGHERGTWRELFGLEFPAPTPTGARIRQRHLPASFISCSVLLLSFVVIGFSMPRSAEIYPTRALFSEFPSQLGPWRGHNEVLEQVYLDQLKLDDYELANYSAASGPPVNFYVSYYNSQRKGEAVHSPRSCLPGGGWQMRDFDQRQLPQVTVGGQPLRVNRTLIELGDQRQLVYYWFQQRGRVITNEFVVKWYLFWDALTRHRTDGAMVRLITPLSVNMSEAEADRRLTDFAARIAPELPRFVPN
jgi:exosortase D (VPLPA-CTERM-specific)